MKRVKNIWEFPRIDFGDPPSPPLEIAQNYLLVFYSQLLKRVPVVLCLGALTGPRENPPDPDYYVENKKKTIWAPKI